MYNLSKEKKYLLEILNKYYVTGIKSRKEMAKEFNLNELTLKSFLYYHKITIDKDKRRKNNKKENK